MAGLGGGALSSFIGRREEAHFGRYSTMIGRQIGFVFPGMFFTGWSMTIVLLRIAGSEWRNPLWVY